MRFSLLRGFIPVVYLYPVVIKSAGKSLQAGFIYYARVVTCRRAGPLYFPYQPEARAVDPEYYPVGGALQCQSQV